MDTELLELFEKFDLKEYATKISGELGMSAVKDFASVDDENISDLGLRPVQYNKLKKLHRFAHQICKETQAAEVIHGSGENIDVLLERYCCFSCIVAADLGWPPFQISNRHLVRQCIQNR
jgi:hypothetical protein